MELLLLVEGNLIHLNKKIMQIGRSTFVQITNPYTNNINHLFNKSH